MTRATISEKLERGREAYAGSAWTAAYESLTRADELEPLPAGDLELLAISAYMSAARTSGCGSSSGLTGCTPTRA